MENQVKRFVKLFVAPRFEGDHDFFPRDCWLETDEENRQWLADALWSCVADKANYEEDSELKEEMIDLCNSYLDDENFQKACNDAVWADQKAIIECERNEEREFNS